MIRYCSYTFQKETLELKLLRCSKCRLNYYCSKAAQKSHWSVHKKTCGSLESSVEAKTNQSNMTLCLSLLKRQLSTDDFDATTVVLMKRIRILVEQQSTEENMEVGMTLHNFIRVLYRSDKQKEEHYNLLWSAPGMTNYLLNEVLLTPGIASVMLAFFLPRTCSLCNISVYLHYANVVLRYACMER